MRFTSLPDNQGALLMKVESKTGHIFALANHQNSHIMPYLRAAGAGTMTGMRSMSALPAISIYFFTTVQKTCVIPVVVLSPECGN
jgi:hypothetical protein